MTHHTAVHLVGGSARKILGPHIWQAGSHKGVGYARLDVTHFQRLSLEDLAAIEDDANQVISANEEIEKLVLARADADARFGFDIYQGGAPRFEQVRVIKIGSHDIQACAGTHHDRTGAVGELRLIRSSAVQDGVERLHIVAGETAREHARQQEQLLRDACAVLGVEADDLPRTAERFFSEWKSQQKRIEQLEAEIVRLRTSGGGDSGVDVDGVRCLVMQGSGSLQDLQRMAGELTRDADKPTVVVLGSHAAGGQLLVAITEGTAAAERYNAVDILNRIANHIGGGGGGRPTFAQGGGSNPDGLEAALDAARSLLGIS
jgi:alanyl-tRNA synthetase